MIWNKTTKSIPFWIAVVVSTIYGGSKHATGTVSYPRTDSDVQYLTDAGSYVTNDCVHIAFTRVIVPATATLLIDYRRLDLTNATDWVSFTNTTFDAFHLPQDLACHAATNYNWMVYTTWTPGSTVQTNGVWHAYWGMDKRRRGYFIPIRTCVRDNARVIATPKSVEESLK